MSRDVAKRVALKIGARTAVRLAIVAAVILLPVGVFEVWYWAWAHCALTIFGFDPQCQAIPNPAPVCEQLLGLCPTP